MNERLLPGVLLMAWQTEADRCVGILRIEGDGPLFAGHFPRRPVLPAVGQIQLLVELCSRALGEVVEIVSIPRAKFMRIIGPDAVLTCEIHLRDTEARWTLRQEDVRVSEGILVLRRE
jgi:3-hydroxyacyl-[acyl-carrier-protein] dehydratase